MSKRRRLSDAEKALWDQVKARAKPMHPARPAEKLPKPSPKQPEPQQPAIKPFRMGTTAMTPSETHARPSPISDRLAAQPVEMDRKAFTRLKRGKLKPEGRIDLHGMTLDRAHPALRDFTIDAHAAGKRLVLVITGKGNAQAFEGRGVLKRQVPHWLRSPPLAHLVMEVREAHIRHGGGGAYYVYLRRSR